MLFAGIQFNVFCPASLADPLDFMNGLRCCRFGSPFLAHILNASAEIAGAVVEFLVDIVGLSKYYQVRFHLRIVHTKTEHLSNFPATNDL